MIYEPERQSGQALSVALGIRDCAATSPSTRAWSSTRCPSGDLQAQEVWDRGVALKQALQRIVKAENRTFHHDALTDWWTVAAETGLSENWVFNAVASGLLQILFPDLRMNAYYDARSRGFRVPPDFGMTL